jgi:hypothetical protein
MLYIFAFDDVLKQNFAKRRRRILNAPGTCSKLRD